MGSLNGRVAIDTGAGRGIGRSVALLLASEGASVVVNDLGGALDGSGADVAPARQVADEIAGHGGTAVPSGADVSDHPAAQDLIKTAVSEFGRLDVLVNAAGIPPGAATRMTESVPDERRRARTGTDDERSPDNVAPLVAYLASERSGWITGRIVHAAGYEVALYNNPQPVARVIGTGPWSLDALAAQVERSFGPMLGRS